MSKCLLLVALVALCSAVGTNGFEGLVTREQEEAEYVGINDFLDAKYHGKDFDAPKATESILKESKFKRTNAMKYLSDLPTIDSRAPGCFGETGMTIRTIAYVVGYKIDEKPTKPIEKILNYYAAKHSMKCIGAYLAKLKKRDFQVIVDFVKGQYQRETSAAEENPLEVVHMLVHSLSKNATQMQRIKNKCDTLDHTNDIMKRLDFDIRIYGKEKLSYLANVDLDHIWLAWQLCSELK